MKAIYLVYNKKKNSYQIFCLSAYYENKPVTWTISYPHEDSIISLCA